MPSSVSALPFDARFCFLPALVITVTTRMWSKIRSLRKNPNACLSLLVRFRFCDGVEILAWIECLRAALIEGTTSESIQLDSPFASLGDNWFSPSSSSWFFFADSAFELTSEW